MLREHGHEVAIETLTNILVQADVATGGEGNPKVCEIWASVLLDKFQHRSVEAFVLAIRRGLGSGKIFGRLNVTQVSEWLDKYEEETLRGIDNETMTHKFTGDNLGADYMDRLEHDATQKDRTITAQSRLIDDLRKKLSTK